MTGAKSQPAFLSNFQMSTSGNGLYLGIHPKLIDRQKEMYNSIMFCETVHLHYLCSGAVCGCFLELTEILYNRDQ